MRPKWKCIFSSISFLLAGQDFKALEILLKVQTEPGSKIEDKRIIFDRLKETLIKRLSDEQNRINNQGHLINKSTLSNMTSMLVENNKKEQSIDIKEKNNTPEFSKDMLLIATDKNLFLTIISNLYVLSALGHDSKIEAIKGISVYKNPKTGKITDFWHYLEFKDTDGKLIDTTSHFEGVMKNSREELLNESKMGKSGFYYDIKITENDEWMNTYKLKKLIPDIAYFRRMDVPTLMSKNMQMNTVNDIIFYNEYPLRPGDTVEVCVCQDNNCKSPCTEIRRVERKNFL